MQLADLALISTTSARALDLAALARAQERFKNEKDLQTFF
jgi:hypothetical protein